ncbi:MAG: hypothetical protein Q4D90_05200 [bacterium]|nr:hypothetical protein [bacterium]
METVKIGELIGQLRRKQNITLQQLSRGICSIATLGRIEESDGKMTYIMAGAFFERLGYTLDKFECYVSQKELDEYNLRNEIRNAKEHRRLAEMKLALEKYAKQTAKKEAGLERQFLDSMNAFLLFEEGNYDKAEQLLRKAIELSVPTWEEKWEQQILLGYTEIEMLVLLSDIYDKEEGQKQAEAEALQWKILGYLEERKEHRENIAKAYAEVSCRLIAKLIEKQEYARALYLSEKAITVIGKVSRMYHWVELLCLRGKCLEELSKDGKVNSQQARNAYQEAYYIALLYETEKEELAQKLKKHLEEEYQWESIK